MGVLGIARVHISQAGYDIQLGYKNRASKKALSTIELLEEVVRINCNDLGVLRREQGKA